MNAVDFQDPVAVDAALRRSQRLWPDPFDAPDVPPRDMLADYMRGGVARLPHVHGYRYYLPKQITESINCQRALEALRAEQDPDHILHPAISAELEEHLARQAWEVFKAQLSKSPRPPIRSTVHGTLPAPVLPPQPPATPTADQIWTTSHEVKRFDGFRRQSRYTWHPVNVLLAEGPRPSGDDLVWRAMPCSPLDFWGVENVGDAEAVVEVSGAGTYVVHFQLEYPVSKSQLHAFVGVVADRTVEPGKAAATSELRLERLRLFERAKWLSATADAFLAEWEHKSEVKNSVGQLPTNIRRVEFSDARAGVPAMAASGGGAPLMPAFLWHGSLPDYLNRLQKGEQPAGLEGFRVKLIPPGPQQISGQVCAQWSVEGDVPPSVAALLQPGLIFFLLDRMQGRVLGDGNCREGGVFELTNGDWPEVRDSDRNDWALLLASGERAAGREAS